MIDEDRTTWTLGQLADEVIEACELPMGCRATIIAALADAKAQGNSIGVSYAGELAKALSDLVHEARNTVERVEATIPYGTGALMNVIERAETALSIPSVKQPDALKEMEARKDAAYEERNRVVAALAWMALFMGWKAGVARTNIPGWSEDWHGCVYIDLPSGQVSWHYHDSHAGMFSYLPKYEGKWDGHTTEQKYSTLTALCSWRDHFIPKKSVNGVRTAKPWGEQSTTERLISLLRSARQEIPVVSGETAALCGQIDATLAAFDSGNSQGNPA